MITIKDSSFPQDHLEVDDTGQNLIFRAVEKGNPHAVLVSYENAKLLAEEILRHLGATEERVTYFGGLGS